mmetsp:Transcript_79787/g.247494  ORF Transcript_79787/g.247494 Transcript_79787/m.247494 type:complete len:205 (+) Transcript_79787:465-1079(+)
MRQSTARSTWALEMPGLRRRSPSRRSWQRRWSARPRVRPWPHRPLALAPGHPRMAAPACAAPLGRPGRQVGRSLSRRSSGPAPGLPQRGAWRGRAARGTGGPRCRGGEPGWRPRAWPGTRPRPQCRQRSRRTVRGRPPPGSPPEDGPGSRPYLRPPRPGRASGPPAARGRGPPRKASIAMPHRRAPPASASRRAARSWHRSCQG